MERFVQRISTGELKNHLNDPNFVIADVRPVEAYNGWPLRGESRGGHIKGARSLPLKWINYIDWIEIVRSKNIRRNQTVVLYGYDAKSSLQVADFFNTAGYPDIRIYEDFFEEWVNNPGLPMERLSRYQYLVGPDWVKKLIEGIPTPTYSNDDFVICHAHYQNPGDYRKGHIPGAISLDTNLLESPETWNRRTPEELKNTLLSLGITADTTVVLYGRFSFPKNDDPFPGSSAGHLGAIRCAFIMLYAGIKDVRILNGGLQSWLDEGYEITKEETLPEPAGDFGAEIPQKPDLAVDMPEAKQMLEASDAELVCVRSWPEYTGEVSGYNYIEKKGRIPGAVFGNCGTDAYHMENYRNLDHTTKEYHEIEAAWREAGIVPEKHLAFYCGTGWRGSEAWLNAWLMGWPRVSVFDGGWFEWSNDPQNPRETEEPDQAGRIKEKK